MLGSIDSFPPFSFVWGLGTSASASKQPPKTFHLKKSSKLKLRQLKKKGKLLYDSVLAVARSQSCQTNYCFRFCVLVLVSRPTTLFVIRLLAN